MQCDRATVKAIRSAVEASSYIADDGRLRNDALSAAMAIATLVGEDALEPGPDARHAGVSWPDEDGRSNALFVTGRQRIHATVAGDAIEATSYLADIDTLKAEDIQQLGATVDEGWRVMKWHLTLGDGSVITLRAANGQHADEVAEFVRAHLLPGSQ